MIEQTDREKELVSRVPIGGIFEHYKGPRYKVYGIARHSEDLQLYVYYQTLYDFAFWIRPLEMFTGMLEVDGKFVQRFKLCEAPCAGKS